MDLVADMLFLSLKQDSLEIQVEQLRPAMKQPLSRLGRRSPNSKFRNADRLFHRFVDYPAWLRKQAGSFDIFHIVDHSYSQLVHELPAERTVVSCHDLDTFGCVLYPKKEKRSKPFRFMTSRILGGLSKAARVVCVTCAVKDELLGHGILPADRIRVVLNGAHPDCSPHADSESDHEVTRLLNLGADSQYLLHVGSTIPRKRIDSLLHVFQGVKKLRPNIRLVRVGGPFTPSQTALAHQLGIQSAIHILPRIDRRTLSAVYRRAGLLLLTSDAEGFGLPVVEAMACGCPVVASDLEVLRETGGSPAVFCPIGATSVWVETVTKLLLEKSTDPSFWAKRRQACLLNAARFSWNNSALQFAEIYKTLAGRPNAEQT